MLFQATSTLLRVEGNPPVLNGGWWSPFRRQERIVSVLTSAGTLVQLPATSRALFESDQSSDVAILTQYNSYRSMTPNADVTGLAPERSVGKSELT